DSVSGSGQLPLNVIDGEIAFPHRDHQVSQRITDRSQSRLLGDAREARLLPFFHRYAGGAKAESKVSWNGRESFEKAAPYPWFAKTQGSYCVSGGQLASITLN